MRRNPNISRPRLTLSAFTENKPANPEPDHIDLFCVINERVAARALRLLRIVMEASVVDAGWTLERHTEWTPQILKALLLPKPT